MRFQKRSLSHPPTRDFYKYSPSEMVDFLWKIFFIIKDDKKIIPLETNFKKFITYISYGTFSKIRDRNKNLFNFPSEMMGGRVGVGLLIIYL